jgi:hypothetical protein
VDAYFVFNSMKVRQFCSQSTYISDNAYSFLFAVLKPGPHQFVRTKPRRFYYSHLMILIQFMRRTEQRESEEKTNRQDTLSSEVDYALVVVVKRTGAQSLAVVSVVGQLRLNHGLIGQLVRDQKLDRFRLAR